MLFNSVDFALFLPLVFILYWFGTNKNLRLQNVLLVLASYVFYGWWDWRFLSLIIFSTLIDFGVGLGLSQTENERLRKTLLWTSVGVNLGFLGVFKYYNFFVGGFVDTFSLLGSNFEPTALNIILPVGISFYTFQTMSYTLDVYHRKIQATRDVIAFAAFVSFFPQLVAGPIERASRLLPQFCQKRTFDYSQAIDGMKQILWGLFKKMVIADNCAEFANTIFGNSEAYPGSTLILGALFFTFQIYGDFSGYSDIAIGTSRLFGFNLTKNFAFPYFSRDIAEFWRRWHISLSTWFRDYLYIPLGGSRGSTWKQIRNIFIVFVVSGFWHGANWTFLAWGALNALFFLPLLLTKNNRQHLDVVAQGNWLPTIREVLQMGLTFSLTVLAWVFFRATDLSHAFSYLGEIFSRSVFTVPQLPSEGEAIVTLLLICFLLVVEWLGREHEYGIQNLFRQRSRYVRWLFYAFVLFCLGMFMQTEETPFIYFQF